MNFLVDLSREIVYSIIENFIVTGVTAVTGVTRVTDVTRNESAQSGSL